MSAGKKQNKKKGLDICYLCRSVVIEVCPQDMFTVRVNEISQPNERSVDVTQYFKLSKFSQFSMKPCVASVKSAEENTALWLSA
ncbi:hypothetical protein BaRGS_00001017 [Batillaria attramentaria]|uniref:Uncharacterized protein n=1 Tax=Batillaria attramentaria TaxID=370345 RepID=A0ABD0M8K3_9CAEN